jgi:hypothetical protein
VALGDGAREVQSAVRRRADAELGEFFLRHEHDRHEHDRRTVFRRPFPFAPHCPSTLQSALFLGKGTFSPRSGGARPLRGASRRRQQRTPERVVRTARPNIGRPGREGTRTTQR